MSVCLAACGGTPRQAPAPVVPKPRNTAPVVHHLSDPDLNHVPPKKLLTIDWTSVKLGSDADALALWKQIAPTTEDWDAKLDEIPADGPISTQLAVALLHEGNLTCAPVRPQQSCGAPLDVPDPIPGATLADPCLRRLIALWALEQIEDDDVARVRDALRAIAAIPPPESQLVAQALKTVPESDQDLRLDLLATAFAAGHRDIVNGLISTLDESHVVAAATKFHIDGAFDVMSPQVHRSAYLAAVADDKLIPSARVQAITELVASEDTMSKEVRAALIAQTRAADCSVAAMAARQLVQHGDTKFGPARSRSTAPAAMMRAMCVLASYEQLQAADEPSYLLGYVPKKGLELVTVAYDSYSDTDDDGDGDPHTTHQTQLLARSEVMLPELEDLIHALAHCTGTVCRSDEREFRFTFKGDQLTRLEVVELPPCVSR